jgi:phosphinothricin acetyltransferase
MEGSTLLGFATYSQFRGGVGYQHTMEHTVVLAPEARGRGAGRALMQRLESHAASSGVHSMIAGVSGANAPGIAFHEAMGYKTVAVVPEVGRKFDQWLDLHLMQKIL